MSENRSALVVDDERMIRELVSEILKIRGYEVRTAPDGEEGVKAFRRQPCDLILLDISMPHMDGLEALKHFRALDAHVGIVLMTGHGGDKERIEGERLGAVFITKPFNVATINALLDVLEEGRASWSAAASPSSAAIYGPVASGNDRRRHVRATVDILARATQQSEPDSESRDCKIVDISFSGGGVQFHVAPPFPQHAEVHVTFTPPAQPMQEAVTIVGNIVWADFNSGLCGVQFQDLDEKELLMLEAIVVEALRRSAGK